MADSIVDEAPPILSTMTSHLIRCQKQTTRPAKRLLHTVIVVALSPSHSIAISAPSQQVTAFSVPFVHQRLGPPSEPLHPRQAAWTPHKYSHDFDFKPIRKQYRSFSLCQSNVRFHTSLRSESEGSPDASSVSSTYGSSAVRSIRPNSPTSNDTHTRFQLLSFYRFVPIDEPEGIRDALFNRLKQIEGLRGTVYVAKEGINAQFAVPVGEPLQNLIQAFGKENSSDEQSKGGCLPFDTFQHAAPNLGEIVDSDVPTFDRLIVRTRDCILRDGMSIGSGEGNDSTLDWSDAGKELEPSEWDAELRSSLFEDQSRPIFNSETNGASPIKIQLLDCRNDYESDQGTFLKATPLNTQTFSDTWSTLDSKVETQNLDPSEPVYIFCTGGIRCVKVGAYLRQKLGFKDVRSLKHGIIGYEKWWRESQNMQDGESSENVGGGTETEGENNRNTLWVGENFLFDKRRLAKGEEEKTSK